MKFMKDKFDYLFVAILIVVFFAQLFPLINFQQLPSPLYGGDYYHQMGGVNHIKNGGDLFVSFVSIGESIPAYFPLYHIIVGAFAGLTGIGAMSSMFIFGLVFLMATGIILYVFGKKLFKNKLLSLLFVASYYFFSHFMIKYTEMARFVFFPLFFLLLFLTLQKKSYIYAIFTGVVYGLNSISHGTGFTFLSLFLVLLAIQIFIVDSFTGKKFSKEKFKKNFKFNFYILLIIFFIGFLIAQLYWFEPIFKYKVDVPNKVTDWGQVDYARGNVQWAFMKSAFSNIFNFSSFFYGLRTLLFLMGAYALFTIRKANLPIRYVRLIFASFIIIPFHFLLTIPILGVDFSPHYMKDFISVLAIALTVPLSLLVLNKFMSKKNLKYLGIFLVVVLVVSSVTAFNKRVDENQWFQTGFREFGAPYLLDVSDWINENTDINDGFISSKELGSSVNAFTGRKFLSVRRNQHPITSDVDQREADLAVILYGNNDVVRKALLEKYDIKYLYWDANWITSEFIFTPEGQFAGYFDPIMIMKTNEMVDYFNTNNVSYVEDNMIIDSAKRNDVDTIKTFDVLVAIRGEINPNEPWVEGLNNYLTLEQEFFQGEQAVARIYSVTY